MIESTDLMDGNTQPYGTVPIDQVAAAIRSWYPTDDHVRPSELAAVDELQAAIMAEDDEVARRVAAALAVGFDEVAET